MAALAWLALVVVAPFVLLAPGYLALRSLGGATATEIWGEGIETLCLAVVASLAILVLVAFVLGETVGLSRWSLATAVAGLLAVEALLSRFLGSSSRRGEAGPESSDAASQPLSPWPGGLDLDVSFSSASVVLIGATLAIVATGALLYDGTEPYSEAAYAEASEVPSTATVEPGQALAWTVVVENHEERSATYTLETVLVANTTAGDRDPSRAVVDEGRLELADDEAEHYEVAFWAPQDGTWKVLTLVHVDGREEPLTLHRWIEVR